MNKNLRNFRSVSNLDKMKYREQSLKQRNNNNNIKSTRIRLIKSKKSTDSIQQYSHVASVVNFSDKNTESRELKFNTKKYIQLLPSSTNFDLRGRSLKRDIKSLNKLLNYENVIKKANDVHEQIKVLINKQSERYIFNQNEIKKSSFKHRISHLKARKFFKEIKDGNLEEVILLVTSNPELINEVDATEQSALH